MISFHRCLLNVQGTFGFNTANDTNVEHKVVVKEVSVNRHTQTKDSIGYVINNVETSLR